MNHFLPYFKCSFKRSIVIVLVLFCFQHLSFAQIQNGSFVFDGLNRNYIVFLPQNVQPDMPVVFVNLYVASEDQTVLSGPNSTV